MIIYFLGSGGFTNHAAGLLQLSIFMKVWFWEMQSMENSKRCKLRGFMPWSNSFPWTCRVLSCNVPDQHSKWSSITHSYSQNGDYSESWFNWKLIEMHTPRMQFVRVHVVDDRAVVAPRSAQIQTCQGFCVFSRMVSELPFWEATGTYGKASTRIIIIVFQVISS